MTVKQNGTLKWLGTVITITVLVVTATLTFASKADRAELGSMSVKLNDTCERLSRAEEKAKSLETQLDRIERKLDRLLERDGR